MAVYTLLSAQEIEALIAPFQLGRLNAATGISAGVENSNYFIDTERGEYVLTIAESQSHQDLVFIARLTSALAGQGLPVPAPIAAADGCTVFTVRDKPAVLIPKITGAHPLQPNIAQCIEVGRALGRFHRVTSAAGFQHTSNRSLGWVAATARGQYERLEAGNLALLKREITALTQFVKAHSGLPQAIIHGDLFRDNTLFEGDRLTAIIDFFAAGTGFLLFDLAVVINDWCARPDGTLQSDSAAALLDAYARERPPLAAEREQWPTFLRIAALRFWVSRLAEAAAAPERLKAGALLAAKDPDQYRKILLLRIGEPFSWPL